MPTARKLSLKSKMDKNRTWHDHAADVLTRSFGTILFFALNAVIFLSWIVINTGLIPGLTIFDPFPFGLLTTAVSLEAIFLSIIVLISQNRASKLDDLREELGLQINIQSEEEITKILNMLDEVHDHLGLSPDDDRELIRMKRKTNINKMEGALEQEIKDM